MRAFLRVAAGLNENAIKREGLVSVRTWAMILQDVVQLASQRYKAP